MRVLMISGHRQLFSYFLCNDEKNLNAPAPEVIMRLNEIVDNFGQKQDNSENYRS